MLRRAVTGASGVLELLGKQVESTVNQTDIRIAVTGLSRAGKTVFLTSLVCNLLALGKGLNTLPKLHQKLTSLDGGSQLVSIRIVPPGAQTVPYFDYDGKLARLAAPQAGWPDRTDHLALTALELTLKRSNTLAAKLMGTRRIRLELLDYPGEWLLDIALIGKSYDQWSRDTLSSLRAAPMNVVAADFLRILQSIEAADIADSTLIKRAHDLYLQALCDARSRLGLQYLQPGRFLCPGPSGDAPYLWFFPIEHAPEAPQPGTVGALLRDRFEAYKAQARTEFFDTHFTGFNRQIVLVDVLAALRAGRTPFEDVSRAIGDIANSMSYRPVSQGRIYNIATAAVRAGKAAIGRNVGSIEKVAFVATKADHVPALRRQYLQNLLRDLVERAGGKQLFSGSPISFHSAAAVLSTRDDKTVVEGREIEVVRGKVVGEDGDKAFFAGDVPAAWPPESFWTGSFFEVPKFNPPRLDSTGQTGIPHLGLDEVISTVLDGVV